MTFFRALFVSLINFTGLFPPGVHCALELDISKVVSFWDTLPGTTSCRKKKRKGAVDGGGSSKMTTS